MAGATRLKPLLCLLATLGLFLSSPAWAFKPHTADWQPVDAADPDFTIDRAAIEKSLFPTSDADNNILPVPRLLSAYVKVRVRSTPHDGVGQSRVEDWALDCKGNYAILAVTEFDPDGKKTSNMVIDYHNPGPGPRGVGLWGPEHFMAPVDKRAGAVQAIACTPAITAHDPVPVTDLREGHWVHGRKQEGNGGWNDEHLVHGWVGADEVSVKLNLFAQPQGEAGPFGPNGAQAGVKIGLSAEDFSRRLGFFPAGNYLWGNRANCIVDVRGDGIDTSTGFDRATPLPGRAVITARSPAAANKLIEAIASGNYDLTINCGDYPQPVVFHIVKPMPPRMRQDFEESFRLFGGASPHHTLTEGL